MPTLTQVVCTDARGVKYLTEGQTYLVHKPMSQTYAIYNNIQEIHCYETWRFKIKR